MSSVAGGEVLFLGIEIGGTKLQVAVGDGTGPRLLALERREVRPQLGALGILEQIETVAAGLLQKHQASRIGIGFGGPVQAGRTLLSHQIEGWGNFPLAQWCEQTLGLPTVIGNDCDAAALAEATWGAGKNRQTVFYVTVGTGVGGGLVSGGKLYGAGKPAVAEIGHLRPGLHATHADDTVESLASGWGIAAAAQDRISGSAPTLLENFRRTDQPVSKEIVAQRLFDQKLTEEEYIADLLDRCNHDLPALTARLVGQAAAEGNEIAQQVLTLAIEALGWAIGQTITLLSPDVVVIGGGVSLLGAQQFFAPLRTQVARYAFPPLADSCEIVPAALGELAVVHGAICLAAE